MKIGAKNVSHFWLVAVGSSLLLLSLGYYHYCAIIVTVRIACSFRATTTRS